LRAYLGGSSKGGHSKTAGKPPQYQIRYIHNKLNGGVMKTVIDA
jgi:hypothetical protein